MQKKKLFFLIIFVLWQDCKALKIEITKGNVQPDPIAIVDFVNEDHIDDLGEDIAQIISADLESSGLFVPINKEAFIQDCDSLKVNGPRFADWRAIKSRFLLFGEVKPKSGSSITVNFRLFDVIAGNKMQAISMSGLKKNWRKIAHMIADSVYSRVTNENGYFNTQVVFVEALTAKGKNQKKRLVRMDRDGFNPEPLTDGKTLVLTPRYSPDGKSLAYLSFAKNSANVYLMDLQTKRQFLLGNFEGMTFAPRFSADSKTIVMSFVKNGSSAIYKMNLTSKEIFPVTQHVSIDTSPCFSPDSSQIVFTSDRDGNGKEHIYVMNSDGSNVKRISFGDGKYSQPVWSPRGDMIAFTKQLKGRFYIGVIATDGSDERLITQGFLVEGADWSPNGRYLMFAKENSINDNGNLYVIDLTGHNLRKIKTERGASDCSWSPLLTNID